MERCRFLATQGQPIEALLLKQTKLAKEMLASDHTQTALYDALQACDLTRLTDMLSRGVNVNREFTMGNMQTPLEVVLASRFDENKDIQSTVLLLLEHGADVNFVSAPGWTPLSVLLEHQFPDSDQSVTAQNVLQLLLEQGADANYAACGLGPIERLLFPHWDGAGALQLRALQVLLDHGAEVNMRSSCDASPLHWLLRKPERKGILPLVQMLVENGADVNLVAAEPFKCRTALGQACDASLVSVVQYLLEHGARFALAYEQWHAITTQLRKRQSCESDPIIELLIEHRLLQGLPTSGVLRRAIEIEDCAAVRLFLGAGIIVADSDVLDACSPKVTESILSLLLESGGNPNAVSDNRSALTALEESELSRIDGSTAKKLELLINHGLIVDDSAVLLLYQARSWLLLEKLLEHRYGEDTYDYRKCSSLFLYEPAKLDTAALFQRLNITATEYEMVRACEAGWTELFRFLLAEGASVNAYDGVSTALVAAIVHNRTALIEELLEAGADANLADQSGQRPIDFARSFLVESDSTDMVDLLRRHGAVR